MPPLDHTTNELKLQNRSSITNELLQNIGTNCPNLLELNLYACDIYSNDELSSSLKYIADGCPLLKYIDLTGWDINPDDLNYLFDKCKFLESVILIQCQNINDDNIRILTENCNNLKYLDVSCCGLISDNSLKYLSINCKNLNTLNLHGSSLGNPNITDRGLGYLSEGCKKIEKMMIAYFPSITNSGVDLLLRKCTNLTRDNMDIRNVNTFG